VSGHTSHNSAGEWSAQRLPPRQRLPIPQEVQLTSKRSVLQDEQQTKQQREQLSERLEKQLVALLAIQPGVQPAIQVEIQAAIPLMVHVCVQVATQLRTPLPILPDILLDDEQREGIASDSIVQPGHLEHTISRIVEPGLQTYWTGYWTASGG
jgi:hypothetical protein